MADIHNRLAHGPHQGGMMDGAVCLFIYFTYHINGLKKSKGDVQPDPEHPNTTDGNHKNLMILFQIMISLDYGSLILYYATFYSNYTVLRLMNLT